MTASSRLTDLTSEQLDLLKPRLLFCRGPQAAFCDAKR